MTRLAIKEFYDLAKQAESILDSTYDCRKAEPLYVKILKLVKSHADLRQEFVGAFLAMLGGKDGPWELIQFCMRELQWVEIKEALVNLRKAEINGSHDWRVISVLNDILAVYEPVWEDADLYEYYSKENN
jgi:hypothetical protein